MTNHVQGTQDDFFSRFTPISRSGDEGDIIFSYRGADFLRVQQALKEDPRTVWTYIFCDEPEPIISSGYSFVNREGYIITKEPLVDDKFHIYQDEYEESDEIDLD